ncbi:MAG: hypothetical protein FJY07_08415, partial [Bacteroidetes bacterium]|nr:hypothetical protein [Bacteroidota bacterium]
MLKTTLDLNIYKKVFEAYKGKKEKDEEDDIFNCLFEFRKFLKTETELKYFGKNQKLDSSEILLLQDLTAGFGESNPKPLQLDFKKPFNNRFPSESPLDSVFFLSEEIEEEPQKYEKNNGYFIAFQHDYFEKWKELSFFGKKDELNIRKDFRSWDVLGDYTLPFTDVLIYDDYIFSKKDRITPFFPNLIEVIDKKTPISYNLLVVTHKVDEAWGKWADLKKGTLT